MSHGLCTDPSHAIQRWASELHPEWCGAEYANGCGSHYSEPVDVAATADTRRVDVTSGVPFVSVAAVMFADGAREAQMREAARQAAERNRRNGR